MKSSSSCFKKLALALVLLVSCVCCIPGPVWADTGNVLTAGQVDFTVQADSGGMNASQRAQDFQTKLDNALVASSDKTSGAVSVVYYDNNGVNEPVITVGGYQVAIVTDADAKAANTTAALLAQQWSDGIKKSLGNPSAVSSYVAQLTSPSAASSYPSSGYSQPGAGGYGGGPGPQYRGSVVYADAGTKIEATLETSISTEVSRAGDLVEAKVAQDIPLQTGVIPAGATISGNVSNAKSGRFFDRSGLLTVQFNRIRLPNGVETPISAHIVGKVGKYGQKGQDTLRGEGAGAKAFGIGMRTLGGAGLGAALGTGVGAISGSAGAGAWSGAAIGGGAGLIWGLTLRKGRNVLLKAGTPIEVQLDAPVTVSMSGASGAPPPPGNGYPSTGNY
jgi:hypothetical protein